MIGRSISLAGCLRAAGLLLCSLAMAGAQTSQTAANTATVPRLVQFAGTFHPPANTPGGPVGATFAIYAAQDGGTALWSEDQNVVLDAAGTYTVQLGATSNEGVPIQLFAAGEPRWLEVKFHLPEEVGLPRVLMVSVPYALKAADAETIGGLPPSAFALATAPAKAVDGAAVSSQPDAMASPAVSGTGVTGYVPLWTNSSGALGDSVLFQSGSGSTAKIGINTATPASALDVKGASTVRGTLSLPSIGAATTSAGTNSQALSLAASAFNTGTGTAASQNFRLQAEPIGNDTANTSGMLDLLYAQGSNTPAETGLKIQSNGQIEFAAGQTFPGAGTGSVTSVGSGAGLTGGPITSSGSLSIATGGVVNTMLANPSLTVAPGTGLTGGGSVALGGSTTLNLDTTKVPQLNAANTFTGNQTVNGNLSATGVVSGSSYQIGSNLFGFGSYTNGNAFVGFAGNANTSGLYNTATGVLALTTNTTGWSNTATGTGALQNNTTASGNSAFGYYALQGNSTGVNNTASGLEALFSNTEGFSNTAYGYSALLNNTTGDYNNAIGVSALNSNTTGIGNTAVGQGAGYYITTGAYNTFVGYGASSNLPGANNAAAFGWNAVVNEDNALVLGGTAASAVSVGIGTATPFNDYALDVEATPGGYINGGVVSDSTGGNIYLGMTNGVHKFRVDTNGVTYADGGFQSSGADFAESFAVRGRRSLYEPGDVLEIDPTSNRHLTLSNHPYGTLVAGIYSTKPGLLASPHQIDDPAVQSTEVPLAVVGIVPCKVTAENGAIARGDMLVTSSRAGYAMKGTDRSRMLGAVVGKALEPLNKGTGVIQVLVTLQ
ncbi:MAG TPA: hypothetical protein VMU80_09855 [Bryobacteraceae bacterium]|nr:hypothetical protein [Bryobacteraceae bacterium]